MYPIVFIGIGLSSGPAMVDCLFRTDFQVGSIVFPITGVFFRRFFFRNGAIFSEVEGHSSVDDIVCSVAACCLDVWAVVSGVFSSVWKFVSCVGVLCDFPLFLFSVDFAFLFFGLSGCCTLTGFFFIVSFFGSPDAVSSQNIGRCGAFGSSDSKKRKKDPVLRADLYAK